MIESNPAEVGSSDLAGALPHLQSIPATIECSRGLALALVVSAALLLRTFALGASGFSEDEINKLHAIDAYRHGDVSANAEHPMLMKLAMWASLDGARWWNAHLAVPGPISDEAALRLPNAVAGAGTSALIFLLTEALFDTGAGACAAMFWALDANAAGINRIGKEDTFLLLFLLLAAYWYERGKQCSETDVARRHRWYGASAAAFGLMLASKYMPQYFGLHAVFNVAGDQRPDDKTPDKRWWFFGTMAAAFLAADFALLLPGTWRYVHGYLQGDTLRHTGYNFAHHLYVNAVGASPWGLPIWFYPAFVATKVSLVTLGAAAAGLVWVWRHPRHRGAAFIRVFLVFTLVPYSFVASKFLRYMLPTLAALDVAAGVGLARIARRLGEGGQLAALVAFALVGVQAVGAAPYYALAQNAVGERLFAPGSLFPDDEFYDAGMRQAVGDVARAAAPGAVVCSDAAAVVAEYLDRDGRADVASRSIAHDGIPPGSGEVWVVVQDGHTYFENAAVVDLVERRLTPSFDVRIAGVSAARVYRFR